MELKGQGWYEEKDPHLGKARRHSKAAQKEKLRDTLTAPMKKSSDEDVPILPEISTKQLEKDEIIKLDFTVPRQKAKLLENFGKVNGVDIHIKGVKGCAEIPASYKKGVQKFLSDNGFTNEDIGESEVEE